MFEFVWLAAGLIPAIMVLRSMTNSSRAATAGGGRPSAVCPYCYRGSTAPHKKGCPNDY